MKETLSREVKHMCFSKYPAQLVDPGGCKGCVFSEIIPKFRFLLGGRYTHVCRNICGRSLPRLSILCECEHQATCGSPTIGSPRFDFCCSVNILSNLLESVSKERSIPTLLIRTLQFQYDM